MSDVAKKANAWTQETKNGLLLHIIAQLKPKCKPTN
ncbi:hypothetical protein FOIG_06007 [Fusarium odoratissimum NRRL 54006]|uniref:Uncharacterized protein n=2 Tax=Fusarium oxysporum species complex TaxID=171631 RepID=X0NHN4_FUSOX|nr:uncharacterized protein FOIG_06007 [Fusarium odoratissimum NRRL 54006]EXM03103.1 hypothetical protein FOIG_06007 [Fusarium odoratissimum NRRL 54006]EXM32105.1 hypothetical protein FOTG_03701 [Fusarium oxysporum f. sp. vasinfectum 25433]KAK2699162.1 hypothetical protein QWA68_003442 [Fusarium oxysporum]